MEPTFSRLGGSTNGRPKNSFHNMGRPKGRPFFCPEYKISKLTFFIMSRDAPSCATQCGRRWLSSVASLQPPPFDFIADSLRAVGHDGTRSQTCRTPKVRAKGGLDSKGCAEAAGGAPRGGRDGGDGVRNLSTASAQASPMFQILFK